MALSYEIDSKLSGLSPVLDEHADWYNRVLRRIYYPEEYQPDDFITHPETFGEWIGTMENEDVLEGATLKNLKDTYGELTGMANEVIRAAQEQETKISVRSFDSFAMIYENFIAKLRRLEMDLAQADSGLDVATGLRSKKALWHDMEREMERLSRRGKPFVLALVQIVDHDKIKASQSEEEYKRIIAIVVKLIKKCIRSFDDAYRSDDGEFIMCLKQSEQAGGSAAIARLLRFLDEEELYCEIDGQQHAIDLACCVAEPMPGDEIETLLRNMRQDLGRYELDEAAALEYIEKSPLQRIVESLEDEDEGAVS